MTDAALPGGCHLIMRRIFHSRSRQVLARAYASKARPLSVATSSYKDELIDELSDENARLRREIEMLKRPRPQVRLVSPPSAGASQLSCACEHTPDPFPHAASIHS